MIHTLAYLKVKSIWGITAKAAFRRKKYLKDEKDILRMIFFFIPIHLLGHLLFSYEPKNSQTRKKVELMSFPAKTFNEIEKEIK